MLSSKYKYFDLIYSGLQNKAKFSMSRRNDGYQLSEKKFFPLNDSIFISTTKVFVLLLKCDCFYCINSMWLWYSLMEPINGDRILYQILFSAYFVGDTQRICVRRDLYGLVNIEWIVWLWASNQKYNRYVT